MVKSTGAGGGNMVIHVKKKNVAVTIIWILVLLLTLAAAISIVQYRKEEHFAGAVVHTVSRIAPLKGTVTPAQKENLNERYHRPSKKEELENPYIYASFSNNKKVAIPHARDAVLAYYGILREASNMAGYSGGCGSIGDTKAPYPVAYSLLSTEAKKRMSQKQFEDSFAGIGHITLLQVVDLPSPVGTPPDTRYFMVEFEALTGRKEDETKFAYNKQISLFQYFYGIVTVTKENGEWKIANIQLLPEEFLCAPYHSWFYDSAMVVPIIYQENLKLIDSVTHTTEKDGIIQLYAHGKNNEYRFDFVRLTNGHDILISENINENGKWVNTDLLGNKWKSIKLSPNTDFS